MLLHRLRKSKRGFSTVIAVVLSLVILVVIVANVVLWDYSMSQIDWDRTKEDMRITNATSITNTTWATAKTEYTVSPGQRASDSYTDTKQVDGSFESFAEGLSVVKSFLRGVDLTGVNPTGKIMNTTQPSLGQSETSSVIARGASVYFYTPMLVPESVANGTWVLHLWSSTMSSGKSSQLTVQLSVVSSNGSIVKAAIGAVAGIVVGYGFSERIISIPGNPAAITSGDRIRLTLTAQSAGGNDSQGMHFYYDGYGTYETQGHETRLLQLQSGNSLALSGHFSIDLSAYPLSVIKSIELQIVYRASDTFERWYLKAFNWTAGIYDDSGFNSTAGNVPGLTWGAYAVNITRWRSYVNTNGTLTLCLRDNQVDINRTGIDIDFFGMRIMASGARFAVQNKGPVTLHLVSLWIDNSTLHRRYELDIFINAGDTATFMRSDISLPSNVVVKTVTARGNVAVYRAD